MDLTPSTGNVNGKQLVFSAAATASATRLTPRRKGRKRLADGTGPARTDLAPRGGEGHHVLKKVCGWFDCNPPEHKVDKDGKPYKYPIAEGPSEINATPVLYKNCIYVPVGRIPSLARAMNNLTCIDATKTGDVTKTAKIWSYDKIHRSIATVSIDPATGLLFVGDFSGYVHCLDAGPGSSTGRMT